MTEQLKLWFLFLSFWSSGVVFAYPMDKRNHFHKRIAMFISIITMFFVYMVYFAKIDTNQAEVSLKIVFQLLLSFFLYGCWKVAFSVAVYNMIWAAAIWQLLVEVWYVLSFYGADMFARSSVLELAAIFLLFAIAHWLCAKTIAKWMPDDRKNKIGPRQMSSAILLFIIIEMLSYAPSLRVIDINNHDWKFLYLSQMMCIVILYLQNELFKKSEMKQELELMNLLWKKEQEQYHMTKETIALINQKSHDLKHQIRALRKVTKEEFEQYLDEMEDSVLIYDAIVKTGNDVFDTILTEKSLYCKDREIQVTCVADGSQMDFINTVDLYAILGNAMDNAIEAVEKFEDKEKRQIDVIIYRQQNFLVMNFINPMPERLVYEEELPVTTKGDKRFHGFGLRSIRYIAKKYDGFVNVSEEDGCFSLKILMPIKS